MVNRLKVEKAITDLLEALGENPQRDGLLETPKRVAKMYEDILSGYGDNPSVYLKFFQEETSSEVIVVRNIPVNSVCEHHLLPFIGKANIVYKPKNGKIIGLSKFSRIVDCFAKKLQIQERLTNQIASFIYKSLNPKGVLVQIVAKHLCMTMRGVKASNSKTETMVVFGVFADDIDMKKQAINLISKN